MVLWTLLLPSIKRKTKHKTTLIILCWKRTQTTSCLLQKTNTVRSFSVENRMQSLGTQRKARRAPFPHLCLLVPIPALQGHLFPAPLSKWEILLSPPFPNISGNPAMSIFKHIFGNNRSSIFTLKMYFSDLGIRISTVFYTKALNRSIYLVASVNEILDTLGIASWLHVPGLYSRPLQTPVNSADRVNWINRFLWPCPSTKPKPFGEQDIRELVSELYLI